jgi:hypothetical protein
MRSCSLLVLALTACALPAWSQSAPARPGSESCVAALDSMMAVFRHDHPGYTEQVAGREAELAALTARVRAVAGTSDHHSVCIGQALQPWARFFRDRHVQVWQGAPPSPAGSAPPPAAAPPADDPERPSLAFRDDGVAVFRLPSLDWVHQATVDSLVAAHRTRLPATPRLVVDVRGNGGGSTGTYAALVPFLYTGPIRQYGADFLSSEGNRAMLRAWLADPTLPEASRDQVRAVLALAEASPGRSSSCEDFVQLALQSDKVTVFGPRNTGGVGDYGNVRRVALPGWRWLRIPTSRSRHLLAQGPLDGVGIAPEVLVPADEPDAVAFALRHLGSATRETS